ncbi:M20/M25/M40 family metallo-hydrolase [Ralstonia mannitolilytica]|uniref:N-acyl-L-amino-acid amidohydrolase n=2 Tax=Pseudomonadota TaxID=1224 RepID=A0AAJ4ZNL6_9RALS|nr:M20/M25/M40 family metallo-hydrolase [Ralstonia mannitolilytica]CAG2130808.1 Succinyl-diaminopimelate desuccinylase [Ralstonia mannitolilytica]CAJ0733714.1 Succinyl-diaminopimelate desuccinylase [Ralstonia mannitolilytica]SUE24676.1 N-acyl-L-amino-acid amidohydrolase [Ralstonia mannitolilytica]SUE25419.1 N-acyl-L-amino-acid amidohydrolase [Ralstonia mannitolilytica]SUE35229.1 N-acyl-L-amino-acid amidohydrolase [Ralstonia mannitolilytica]
MPAPHAASQTLSRKNPQRCTWLAALLLGAAGAASAADLSTADAERYAQGTYREYFEVLSLPNDAIAPEDIRKNVDWLEQAFRKRGFTTRQLANDGKPMLFAELPNADPARKTVLFYMHLDGQPVIPAQWAQKSPWTPVLKRKTAQGGWEEIDPAQLFNGPLDPEWRVFGRASADDKGPIMMMLAAIDALKAQGAQPAVNVKVILDSEEEKGSPSISKIMQANRDLLRCDAIVIHDGPMHATNLPTLIFGNRGAAEARLTVYGGKVPLHSGHYGNYAPNPAQRLATLLASMKSDDGRVTIPGYYDHVKISEADRQIMAAVPDDEAALNKRLGIAHADKVGANYQEAMQYPSLNVRGMGAAAVGDKVANIVPDKAVAELDLRTTPDSTADYLGKLIEQHIVRQGYHLVKNAPTDEERSRYDKLASFWYQSEGADAAGSPIDSAVGKWAYQSLADTFGAKPAPVRIRMMGGTVPTAEIVRVLQVPFAIVPLVNADNNQHAANENLRMGNYVSGVRTIHGLMTHPL